MSAAGIKKFVFSLSSDEDYKSAWIEEPPYKSYFPQLCENSAPKKKDFRNEPS